MLSCKSQVGSNREIELKKALNAFSSKGLVHISFLPCVLSVCLYYSYLGTEDVQMRRKPRAIGP